MKLYTAADFNRARAEWEAGNFGPEWAPFRTAAAAAGFIFPPKGDQSESAEDGAPSQRAILWREIVDRPSHLMSAIARSESWSEVVRRCLSNMGRLRRELDDDEALEEAALLAKRGPMPEPLRAILGELVQRGAA